MMALPRFFRALSVFAFALCALVPGSFAEAPASARPDLWSVRVDNDSLAIAHRSDTNYTMGVAIQVTSFAPNGSSAIDSNFLLAWLDGINSQSWLLPRSADKTNSRNSSRSFLLQDNAFTPGCLDTAANCAAKGKPITQDRPYANLIWTGVRRTVARDDYSSETSELNFGLYGTNIGNVVQTWIHERCCTEKIPQEWKTQIGDGGALTFLYKQTRSNQLAHYSDLDLDFRYKYGFWVGWNTWPTVGLVGRWGPLRAEYDASYVLYNQSIQGAWGGTNTIKYDYADMERVVHLAHISIDLNRLFMGKEASSRWGLRYSQNWKTRDLKVPGEADVHYWGGLEYWHTF